MDTPKQTLEEEMIKIIPENLVLKIDPNAQCDSLKITSSFKITNINKYTKIGFKLNTNQPKLYQFKPTVGIINQGESISIGVIFIMAKTSIEELSTSRHAIRVDSFKITSDMEPIEDIKVLIKNLKQTAQKKMDKVKISFEKIEQVVIQKEEVKKELKKSIEIPNTVSQKENEKKKALLNSLNTQLGDLNLKHEQLMKETQKYDALKQASNNPDAAKDQNNKGSITIALAVIVCLLAFIIGFYLTK